MRLYLDENISRADAAALRQAGHDVLEVQGDKDLATQPDRFHALNAIAQNRVIVTRDKDFVVLHRNEGLPANGVVFLKGATYTHNVTGDLSKIIDRHEEALARGALVSVGSKSERIVERDIKYTSSQDEQLADAHYFAISVEDSKTFPPRDEAMAELVAERQSFERIDAILRVANGGSAELTARDKEAQIQDRIGAYLSVKNELTM